MISAPEFGSKNLVRFLARVIVLCSLAKRLTLTMPVSIQDYVDEYWRTVGEIRQNTKVGEGGTVAGDGRVAIPLVTSSFYV